MSMGSHMFNTAQSHHYDRLIRYGVGGFWSCILCRYVSDDTACKNCGNEWETPNGCLLPTGEDNQAEWWNHYGEKAEFPQITFGSLNPRYSGGRCVSGGLSLWKLWGEVPTSRTAARLERKPLFPQARAPRFLKTAQEKTR